MATNIHPEVSKYFSRISSKRKGKKIPGNRRGDSAYYSELAKKRKPKKTSDEKKSAQ